MPVYTIYHRTSDDFNPKLVATRLTNLHSSVTGAPRDAVKVIFLRLDEDSFFSGGKSKQDYVRVVGQIRQGRSEEQKLRILKGMHDVVEQCFALTAAEKEVQTQIVEIDDTKTVMTNGVLNT